LHSFRKAAIYLQTSPATVSRRISALEATLGAQVFVRTTRKVYLTDIGKTLLANSQQPMLALQGALNRAASSIDEMQGLVRIAATYTIAETNILPVIAQIHHSHPDIKVELLLDESVVDIRDQHIDFAIRIGDLTDPTLISRKLGQDRICYITSPEAGPNPPLLSYGEPEFEPRPPVLRVKDMRLLRTMVKSGFGAAWLPLSLCADDLRSGALVCDESQPEFEFDGFLIYHANRYMPRRTRYVMDEIITYRTNRTAQDIAFKGKPC